MKFLELLRDPDQGLELRDSVSRRLERQLREVDDGERGQPLHDVAERLGLA